MVTELLLLLAIALVLIGVVTLVIGIISNTLAWVFISIGATVAAGVVLYVLYRLGRKQAAAGVGTFGAADQVTAPQPAVPAAPVVPAPTAIPPAPVPAASGDTGFAPDPAGPATEELDTGHLAPSPVVTALPDSYEDEDDLFPIAEYDDLRVAEILPLLPELDADELDVVREREAATKARATILNRIDELAPNALGAWTDGAREEPAAAAAPVVAAPAVTGRRTASAMPIPGYDDLTVAEILPALTRLGAADLEVVADHERRGPNRQTVLNRIEGRIRSLGKGAGDEPTPPATRTTRAAAGGSTARKGPATPTPTALPPAAKRAAAGRSTATRATKATAAAVPAKRGRPAKAAVASAPAPAAKATPRKASAAPATKVAKAGKAAAAVRKSTKAASPAPRPTKRSPR